MLCLCYDVTMACQVDVVGISHFITFLTNTETYRRSLRRAEYGDETDPQMHAFLTSISPLTHIHKIKAPLFVVSGKNDPRVPCTESEQIVDKLRQCGIGVWYLRGENEGHGFKKKINQDYLLCSLIMFVKKYLLL